MSKTNKRSKPRNKNTFLARRETYHSGPLPSPDQLQVYDNVVPGAAERIIKMAENQSSHRQDLEKRVVKSDIWQARIGLFFGFMIAVLGLTGSFYLILEGREIAGSVLAGSTLLSLVGTFVYGSKQRRQEREQQRLL